MPAAFAGLGRGREDDTRQGSDVVGSAQHPATKGVRRVARPFTTAILAHQLLLWLYAQEVPAGPSPGWFFSPESIRLAGC
jgi:hypothetical protein